MLTRALFAAEASASVISRHATISKYSFFCVSRYRSQPSRVAYGPLTPVIVTPRDAAYELRPSVTGMLRCTAYQ